MLSSEIEDGTTDIDSWEMPYEEVVAKYTYTHPCAMFNEADFTRVKTMLDNGSAPQAVKDEFNLLKSRLNSSFTACGALPLSSIVFTRVKSASLNMAQG